MPKVNGSSAPAFRRKLEQTLRAGLKAAGVRADIETQRVPHTSLVRAMVLSAQFKDLWASERQDLVWKILGRSFTPDEQLRISVIALAPNELGG